MGAFVAWVALTWAGGALGWPVGLAFAFDIACLGALGWALIRLVGVWRAERRSGRE